MSEETASPALTHEDMSLPSTRPSEQIELRRTRKRTDVQTQGHGAPGFDASSVTLRWPDAMQHAIFYTDAGCESIAEAEMEATWHVERLGTTSEQCVNVPQGRWRSIEFMRGDEWVFWQKRRIGEENGVGWGWRGVL